MDSALKPNPILATFKVAKQAVCKAANLIGKIAITPLAPLATIAAGAGTALASAKFGDGNLVVSGVATAITGVLVPVLGAVFSITAGPPLRERQEHDIIMSTACFLTPVAATAVFLTANHLEVNNPAAITQADCANNNGQITAAVPTKPSQATLKHPCPTAK